MRVRRAIDWSPAWGQLWATKKSSDPEEEVLDRDEYIMGGWTVVPTLNDLRVKVMALPPLNYAEQHREQKLIILDTKSCLQVLRCQGFLDGLGKTILKYSEKD